MQSDLSASDAGHVENFTSAPPSDLSTQTDATACWALSTLPPPASVGFLLWHGNTVFRGPYSSATQGSPALGWPLLLDGATRVSLEVGAMC